MQFICMSSTLTERRKRFCFPETKKCDFYDFLGGTDNGRLQKHVQPRMDPLSFDCFVETLRSVVAGAKQTLDGETMHLTPALSPFCSADSAKRGEGETLPASVGTQVTWFLESNGAVYAT